jgi:hypothetical protein
MEVWAMQQSFVEKKNQAAAKADKEIDPAGMTLNMIDTDKVKAINKQVMKDLKEPDPETDTPGESLEFWQAGDYLLLGTKHDASYYGIVMAQPNYYKGTLTMAEKGRGRLFNRGTIEVEGTQDTKNFKLAIREFSEKEIKFIDA